MAVPPHAGMPANAVKSRCKRCGHRNRAVVDVLDVTVASHGEALRWRFAIFCMLHQAGLGEPHRCFFDSRIGKVVCKIWHRRPGGPGGPQSSIACDSIARIEGKRLITLIMSS